MVVPLDMIGISRPLSITSLGVERYPPAEEISGLYGREDVMRELTT